MKPKEEITSDQSSPSGVGELNNNTTATIITMNHTDIGDCDDLSDDGDSNDSQFDDTDLIASACQDEITAQLAAAGKFTVSKSNTCMYTLEHVYDDFLSDHDQPVRCGCETCPEFVHASKLLNELTAREIERGKTKQYDFLSNYIFISTRHFQFKRPNVSQYTSINPQRMSI